MKRPLFFEYTDGYYKMWRKSDINWKIPAEPFLLKTLSDFFATADVLKNNVSPTGMTKKIERQKKKVSPRRRRLSIPIDSNLIPPNKSIMRLIASA